MKHNPKLDSPKEDRVRVNITYLRRNDPVDGTAGKVTRVDSIFLTLEEGQRLVKRLGDK